MPSMKLVGPEARAKALISAANRLRWEVDTALGLWGEENAKNQGSTPRDAERALDEIAQVVALLRVTVDSIEQNLPEASPIDDVFVRPAKRFASRVEYYYGYHQTPR